MIKLTIAAGILLVFGFIAVVIVYFLERSFNKKSKKEGKEVKLSFNQNKGQTKTHE